MATVSDLVIKYLRDYKIDHIFGVPGDYVLSFYSQLCDLPDIELINTTDESGAGFAADVYARIHGAGAVCVTYNVGALKVSNAIAGAYAERSPVVVICGSPGIKEREEGILLHHMAGDFNSQQEMFDKITCESIVLDSPLTANEKLKQAFLSMHYNRQPIYIEIPRDIANEQVPDQAMKAESEFKPLRSDKEVLKHAVNEAREIIRKSKKPVILAGVESARFGMNDLVVDFAEKANIPIVTTLLAKSMIAENNPLFYGVYAGKASQEGIEQIVEESDCLIMVGVMMTDMTLSFMPPNFDKTKVIYCSCDEGVGIYHSSYKDVYFSDFVYVMFSSWADEDKKESRMASPRVVLEKQEFKPVEGARLTTSRFFQKIDSILNKNTGIIADVGDSLFGASDLTIKTPKGFIGAAFYASMGMAIPGALGMQTALPDIRPIVLVGDGSFQMSAFELGTIVSRCLNPIVFVLNNRGYTTERFLLDGSFNDIHEWSYHKIGALFNGGRGYLVENEEELDQAVNEALVSDELVIINAIVDYDDISPALRRITSALSKRI